MFKIELKGLKEAQAAADDLIKHRIPKMTAMTLTATAKGLKEETQKELPRRFDRPTPWTIRGVFYKSASVNDMNAAVWFKDKSAMGTKSDVKHNEFSKGTPAAEYISTQVHGGPRNLKGFEKRLRFMGILPDGYYVVPGEGVKLDEFGNISRQTIVKILSAVKAIDTALPGPNHKKRNPRALTPFVGRPGVKASAKINKEDLKRLGAASALIQSAEKYRAAASSSKYPLGVWERSPGHGLIPLLIFVKGAPKYRQRFPFYDWAQAWVDVEWPKIWDRISAETLSYWQSHRSPA